MLRYNIVHHTKHNIQTTKTYQLKKHIILSKHIIKYTRKHNYILVTKINSFRCYNVRVH